MASAALQTLPSALAAKPHTQAVRGRLQQPVRRAVLLLVGLWAALFFASLFTPPLLDDADATHAQAARAMLSTGDWATLHVDGIRYLEKSPLPYWLVAISFRCFGANAFAAHLPGALAVLALALLGYGWARNRFGERAGLYTGCATLTCTGVFLFTRVFIPDVLLSLLLGIGLYALERSLGGSSAETSVCDGRFATPRLLWPAVLWSALALAVLTKGLVVLVLFSGTTILFFLVTETWWKWRFLRPVGGLTLFLLIAAPWHILASVRNTGGEHGHGFAWFYFINEHVLRFLGRRVPRDYNKLPATLYWTLHLVWLAPWSLFAPLPAELGYRRWRDRSSRSSAAPEQPQTALLLILFAAVVLGFFSLSTNQEYYTFPAYLPLLILLAAALAHAENAPEDPVLRRTLLGAHWVYALFGLVAAVALGVALYGSRGYARPADIGSLLTHRGVSNYTLSMASFFDLTGSSFAALRLPAALACAAFAVGPVAALWLRSKRAHRLATGTVIATSTVFLLAAHIALSRFAPMLSSKDFADRIRDLTVTQQICPDTEILLFGDQAYGSSIPFYLDRQVKLVDGRSTSMYFGSTFPDAPPIFVTPEELLAKWGTGRRKILFIPQERHADADRLLGSKAIVLAETSGKLLVTDRPLAPSSSSPAERPR